jgi:hypothetical protein
VLIVLISECFQVYFDAKCWFFKIQIRTLARSQNESQFPVMVRHPFRMASTVVCSSMLNTKESHKGTELAELGVNFEVLSQELTL